MKNLITIVLVLLGLAAQAQPDKYVKPNTTYGTTWNRGKFDSTFRVPVGASPVLRESPNSTPGNLFLQISPSGDTTLFMYTGQRWKKVGQDSTYLAGFGIHIDSYVISVDTMPGKIASWNRLYKVVDSLTRTTPTVTTQSTGPGSILVSTTTSNVYDVVTPTYLTSDSLKTLTNGYTWHLPLYQTSQTKDVYVATNLAVYNASEIQGVKVKPVQPHDGETLTYDDAQGQLVFKPGNGGIVSGFTPLTSTDNTYQIGTTAIDDTYIYYRTSTGTWKKIALTTF
jgi:hypothetical protein